jgi:hypothetical protein
MKRYFFSDGVKNCEEFVETFLPQHGLKAKEEFSIL